MNLTIFIVRFMLGFVQGVGSPITSTAWFVVAVGAALGCLSAGFVVRALAIARYRPEAPKAQF
ncbi:MAG: hypothetical protein AB8C46_12020 [Burkholderiaceae bacterium]